MSWKILLRNSLLLLFTSYVVSSQQQLEDHFETFDLLMPNVTPEKRETFFCTTIKIGGDNDYFIVGFVPNATEYAVSQMLLYGCEEPGSLDNYWDCGAMSVKIPRLNSANPCRRGPQLLYAWSTNVPEFHLPKGVGFHVGGRSRIRYITLQVRYSSIESFSGGVTDNSGIFLKYTTRPPPRSAGVILLGTGGQIGPKTVEYWETACKIHEHKTIHPFAFSTHTHSLGRAVSGYKVTKRINASDEWELIGKQNPHVPQTFYPIASDKDMTVTKGDILAARCTYVSNRDRITKVGMSSEDEMCNFYILYWTQGRGTLSTKYCFTPGAPDFYWHTNNKLNNIPTDASVLK